MNARQFGRMACGLQGAAEGAHMGHADFRVNRRVFASLDRDERWGTVKLALEDQQRLTASAPAVFVPASGAWGLQGWTKIDLAHAGEEEVGEALTLAWKEVAGMAAVSKTRSTGRTRTVPAAKPSTGRDAAVSARAAEVDAYIAACKPAVRTILNKIRSIVREEARSAEDVVGYRMPAFRLDGGALIYYAPFKAHIGIFPPVKGDAELNTALAPYRGPKGNLRFPLDEPMPYPLIRRLVQARIAEHLAERAKRSRR